MDGEGKKRKRKAAMAKLLALAKKRNKKGSTMAELVKWIVKRFHRKRGKKRATAGKTAKSAPAAQSVPWGTPAAIAISHKEREEKSAKVSEEPAKTMIVSVPNVDRKIKETDIVAYKKGDAFRPGHLYWRMHQTPEGLVPEDITDQVPKMVEHMDRSIEVHKEGKSKADKEAKHAVAKASEKEKEAKHAKEEKHKSDALAKLEKAKRQELHEEALDRKAADEVEAKWSKRSKATVKEAARAAGIALTFQRDAKNPRAEKSIKMLIKEALAAGKAQNDDYSARKIKSPEYAKTKNDIYDDYYIIRLHLADAGQDGEGRLDRPTSNDEIDKAMSKVPGFQKTVASDDDFDVKGTPNPKGVSWVMNLDKSGEPGSHWVAVLITPHSVEYSDSFGDHPTPSVQERIVRAGKKLWPENVKTLKINRIKRQDERTSSCGFHAMKFIRDRMSGQSFADVTGYGKAATQVRKGEAEVKEFEKRYPKFVQVGKGILDHPGDNMPDAVKRMLEMHGKEPITSLSVVRAPVHSLISGILNLATLGAFKKALAKYHYDQLFHLYISVNGKYTIEKNATVSFSSGLRSGDNKPAVVPAGTTVEDLFKRGTSAGFWLYDPRSNNCQDFIITVLSGAGALTADLRMFVKQDAVAIFASVPSYAGKLAKFVTDLGGRFDGAKDRIIKFFRGRGADDTIAHMKKGLAENEQRMRSSAAKNGTRFNEFDFSAPENPITWLLRKVGAKKAAAWLHKKDTGEELKGSGQLTRYGNKGPYSWRDGPPLPAVDARKQPLL